MSNPILTKEEQAAIRARLEAATPGPWAIEDDIRNKTSVASEICGKNREPICIINTENQNNHDFNFIVNARQDIPALLDALEAAEKRADEAEVKMQRFAHAHNMIYNAEVSRANKAENENS